ncbi:hypothetical protein CI238_12991 [Colletotrichum incanum]|uniref:Uncharacterized protein n=1 Tax=Colletotrichum incanum TaxID=1573173 RepID=A0A161W3Y8_COLIC|nr:hypothetical protein CI238_12991 [Colletotrichum incanum]
MNVQPEVEVQTYLLGLHPFSWATVFSLLRRCPQTQRLLSRIEVRCFRYLSCTPVLAICCGQLLWKPILDASSGQTTVLENSTASFRFYS